MTSELSRSALVSMIAEAIAAKRQWGLHIVIDDGNIEDDDMQWCLDNSIPKQEPKIKEKAEMVAYALLATPYNKRRRVVGDGMRKYWKMYEEGRLL